MFSYCGLLYLVKWGVVIERWYLEKFSEMILLMVFFFLIIVFWLMMLIFVMLFCIYCGILLLCKYKILIGKLWVEVLSWLWLLLMLMLYFFSRFSELLRRWLDFWIVILSWLDIWMEILVYGFGEIKKGFLWLMEDFFCGLLIKYLSIYKIIICCWSKFWMMMMYEECEY